jgi:two-component system NarL family sensor kinase
LDFLRVVANVLAMGIENADLGERLRYVTDELERTRDESARAIAEAGRLGERLTRERIMQLVHDEALQSLLAARHELSTAQGGQASRERVLRARDAVQRAIVELRGAIGGLHPVATDGRRLEEAARAVAVRAATAAGLRVAFSIAAEADEERTPLLLSVIRELIANAGQHARASEVQVTLRAEGEDLVLEVRDDGVGIAPGRPEAALVEGHIGLASASRRVRAMGGRLELDSGPGQGTCVRVTLPPRAAAGSGHGDGQKGAWR